METQTVLIALMKKAVWLSNPLPQVAQEKCSVVLMEAVSKVTGAATGKTIALIDLMSKDAVS